MVRNFRIVLRRNRRSGEAASKRPASTRIGWRTTDGLQVDPGDQRPCPRRTCRAAVGRVVGQARGRPTALDTADRSSLLGFER